MSSLSSPISNLAKCDPLYDVENEFSTKVKDIHVRVQQRNGRKCITTVTGLPADLNFRLILETFKGRFNCGGSIIDDEVFGTVIQLQGDHSSNVSRFLIAEGLANEANVKIHGAMAI